MLKQTIKYTDFNGKEREEDFYFHLSIVERTRIEAEIGCTIAQHAKKLTEENNSKDLLAFLEKMVLTSYGKKTEDGRNFIKNEELRKEFEYSQAYGELFVQLLTDREMAAKFGEGIGQDPGVKKNQTAPKVVAE